MKTRTILITGAGGLFGRIFVRHFLAGGDQVIVTCRSDASVEKLMSDNVQYGDKIIGCKVDLTNPDASRMIIQDLDRQGVQPSCLVNNARNIEFLKINDDGIVGRDQFANEFLLDVIVPYELTMALVSQNKSKLSRVVNIGSMYGTVAANTNLYTDPVRHSPLHYSVAKAALSHLTKELAVRLAKNNIWVNCVAFGGVEGRVDEEFKQRYAQLCPMGRMLSQDEVAGPVDMFLSDQCSGVTGHTLNVDGGWSIW